MEEEDFTIEELNKTIKKLKKGKAAGPDRIPMEYFKALDQDNRTDLLSLINNWWRAEDIPQEMLEAQVVLIFQKGRHSGLRTLQTNITVKRSLQNLYSNDTS